jgi:glycosyltransferase involved in cell wall biosynthesis
MIYNPAAPEPFPRAVSREDISRRAPVVLAIGRLVPDKDFLTLIRAFARVKCEDARLVILGEGSERGRLVAEARTLGVEERVEMPGFVRDTGAQFDGARCFVVSSRSESFSLACVEALARGLPVAVTDCGGPGEILDGLGVVKATPVGDAAALALAIDALLADPGEPAPRQERARVFSLEAALVAYEREFSAIGSRSG